MKSIWWAATIISEQNSALNKYQYVSKLGRLREYEIATFVKKQKSDETSLVFAIKKGEFLMLG